MNLVENREWFWLQLSKKDIISADDDSEDEKSPGIKLNHSPLTPNFKRQKTLRRLDSYCSETPSSTSIISGDVSCHSGQCWGHNQCHSVILTSWTPLNFIPRLPTTGLLSIDSWLQDTIEDILWNIPNATFLVKYF